MKSPVIIRNEYLLYYTKLLFIILCEIIIYYIIENIRDNSVFPPPHSLPLTFWQLVGLLTPRLAVYFAVCTRRLGIWHGRGISPKVSEAQIFKFGRRPRTRRWRRSSAGGRPGGGGENPQVLSLTYTVIAAPRDQWVWYADPQFIYRTDLYRNIRIRSVIRLVIPIYIYTIMRERKREKLIILTSKRVI